MPRELLSNRLSNARNVSSTQNICTALNRRRSLGVISQSDAWDTQCCRFFLHPSGISHHQARVLHKAEKIEVSQWLNHLNSAFARSCEIRLQPQLPNLLLRSRVCRKNHSLRLKYFTQTFEDFDEASPLIHVGGAMEREQRISTRR